MSLASRLGRRKGENSLVETTPDAILKAELSVKRTDLAFLAAAFRHAGWEVEDSFEGVTTDEGVDTEVKMRVRVHVPIDVLADAPEPRLTQDTSSAILERLRIVV